MSPGAPELEPELLFADAWLLVLAKPSGLLSQPGLGPELADSLISRVQCQWPEARLVHRLDRDTSGLLLLARDPLTHRQLSQAFAERRVAKSYLAWVEGVPRVVGGWLRQPLARIGTRPPRYGVVPVEQGGKPAITRWRLLLSGEGKRSLLLLQPRTGRSHQLRVHLAEMGHPIVGDAIYGQADPGGLRLHATALRLRHPHTGATLRLRCPPHWRSAPPLP